MKQKRALKHKTYGRDHGKDLFDAIIFLMLLLTVLWYLQV
jgi:hypothetical protein